MRFCIVGGFPRAGTRQFTDFLNKHKQVSLKGEVYPQSLKQLAEFIANVDQFHSGKWPEENYRAFRAVTILNTIAGISKGTNAPFNFDDASVFGFKTPYVEFWKASLDTLLVPEADGQIVFCYCVRNLADNFLSQNAFLGIDLKTYVNRTVRSLNACCEITEDQRYALVLLDLDSYIASADQPGWIASHLFEEVGVKVPVQEKLEQIIENTHNRNSTAAAQGERRKELTEEERDVLESDPDLTNALQQFEQITGLSVPVHRRA